MQKWFKKVKNSNDSKMRLFCFPHAGGSAETFKHWEKHIPVWMELYVLQLPGRGNRFSEKLIDSIRLLIDNITTEMVGLLDLPYIFVGHSFGGSVAFELAKKIRNLNHALPSRLFIVGREGPKVPPDMIRHNLSNAEMVRYLKQQAGTNNAIFDDEDLVNLLLPIIRADLKMSETYFEYYSEDVPLSCPIHAFWASGEHELNEHKINEWQKETMATFTVDKFDGDHFFLHKNADQVIGKMLKYIEMNIK